MQPLLASSQKQLVLFKPGPGHDPRKKLRAIKSCGSDFNLEPKSYGIRNKHPGFLDSLHQMPSSLNVTISAEHCCDVKVSPA